MASSLTNGGLFVIDYISTTTGNFFSASSTTAKANVLAVIGEDSTARFVPINNVKQIALTTDTITITPTSGTATTINKASGTGYILVRGLGAFTIASTYQSLTNEITSLLTINSSETWQSLPCPSEYNGSSSTLVDDGRNVNGVVVGNVIRDNIAKIEMTWNYLTISQYSTLAKMFEPSYGGAFFNYVIFFNATLGEYDIRNFYPNDRSFSTAKIKLVNGKPAGYQSVSLNLIEV